MLAVLMMSILSVINFTDTTFMILKLLTRLFQAVKNSMTPFNYYFV